MLVQPIRPTPQSAHVVVLGNEKGGSGKSTTALHIAVALLKAGQRVATIKATLDGKLLGEYPVVALETVGVAGIFGRSIDTVRLWIK